MTEVTIKVGGSTDVGQLRDQNQDSILLGPVLFGVADGMGGHRGGEVASALAVETIAGALADVDAPTTDDLRDAVIRANQAVYERSDEDPAVAGMGTTLVGVALVDDGGDSRVAVVNVGDSRGYRFRRGELTQVTDDHSLVGELLRDGKITVEEAGVHPQKNIVTRVLGVERNIIVDAFHFPASGGDRFLMCSDGLTDEVPEVEIAAVLRNIEDPDDAAAELIRQANDNGGRDNITVVIVDVEGPEVDDGVVPDADDFSHSGEDTASYAPIDGDGSPNLLVGGAGEAEDSDADDPIPDDSSSGSGSADPEVAITRRERKAQRKANRPARAVTLRSIVFVALVLALIGGGIYLINDYATNTYHVALDDNGQVAIFKGRPGGFLWVEPELVEPTELSVADLLPMDRNDLEDGVAQSSLKRARTYVKNLRERIEETTPPVTTTTTAPATTAKPKTPTTTGG